MPRRTMTVTKLWVHPMRDRKTMLDLTNLPGDLLHLFHGFVAEVGPHELLKRSTESFANVHGVMPKGRTLTVAIDVGRYGEEGTITNVETMMETGKFTSEDATSVITHGVMVLPLGSPVALLFLERAANQSGVARALEIFEEKFKLAYPTLKLENETIVESEAWLKFAHLTRVSAHVPARVSDLAEKSPENRPDYEFGDLAHTLLPPKGSKYLPRVIYDKLRAGQLTAGQLLHFRNDEEPEDVEVTLENNNQKKTFVLGNEKRPSISYLVTNHGDPAKDEGGILHFVLQRVKELLNQLGVEWSEANAVGTWSAEQLAVRLVNSGGEQS